MKRFNWAYFTGKGLLLCTKACGRGGPDSGGWGEISERIG